MTDFECFSYYMALKMHFTGSYDIFKYNGKTKLSNTGAYKKRRDQFFFLKLARHEDPKKFLLANVLVDPKGWIRELAFSEQSEKIYKDWTKRNLSLTYNFQSDISALSRDIKSELNVEPGKHPSLMKLYLQNSISLETFIILLDVCGVSQKWDNALKDDVMWDDLSFKMKKYRPFLKYNSNEMKKILFEYVKSI